MHSSGYIETECTRLLACYFPNNQICIHENGKIDMNYRLGCLRCGVLFCMLYWMLSVFISLFSVATNFSRCFSSERNFFLSNVTSICCHWIWMRAHTACIFICSNSACCVCVYVVVCCFCSFLFRIKCYWWRLDAQENAKHSTLKVFSSCDR